MEPYWILAYYAFESVADPHGEVAAHRAFLETRDVTARIYLSEEGINGQLCAAREDAIAYMEWLNSRSPFTQVTFKVHGYHEQAFPRLTIKYRRHLVGSDRDIDLQKRGEYLTPKEWRERLDKEDGYLLLDIRNRYEWDVGHFQGAEAPPCETFRDFDNYAKELAQRVDPTKQTVLMYCTGGIRCELYSALMAEYGFSSVYQLKGGVIGYGLNEGTAHWLGKLFVFDDRLTVPIAEGETPVIGRCRNCNIPSESYYNCANMDCNELFLCCPNCLLENQGCCCSECAKAPRLRPYHQQDPHKPFRRWHHYFAEKPSQEGLFSSNRSIQTS